MKRIVLAITLAALLGTLLNVLVAWFSMYRSSWPAIANTFEYGPAVDWPHSVPGHWPPEPSHRVGRVFGVTLDRFVSNLALKPPLEGTENFTIDVWSIGWPFRACSAEGWSDLLIAGPQNALVATERTNSYPPASIWTYGLPIPIWTEAGWAWLEAPIRPIWPGFIINTSLYALLVATPLLSIHPVRRWLRLRAGLCPRCKYPVGPSPVCTECGTTLPPTRRTMAS